MLNIQIQTTKDILNLAAAISAVGISFFLCWALYYLILNLRDIHIVTRDVRTRVEKFWEVIELLREKLQVGGAIFTLAAHGIKELAEYAKAWNEGATKTKSRKKKTDQE